MRDEEESFERHIQPRLDSDSQQVPLKNLRTLQPSAIAFVIVLEAEVLLIDGHQMVFERCFENINGVQMVTCLFDDIGHCHYLQGPLTHLGGDLYSCSISTNFGFPSCLNESDSSRGLVSCMFYIN